MPSKIKYLAYLLLATGLVSCSTLRKNAVTGTGAGLNFNESEVVRLARNNNILGKGVYINNGRAELKSEFYSGEFSFYAKVNSEEEFVVSLRGPLDIEVVRLYGNRDSAFIIDRINKVVYKGNRNRVLQKYGIPAGFWSYIMGDVPEKGEIEQTATGDKNYVVVDSQEGRLTAETTVSRDSLKAVRTAMIDDNLREILSFSYYDLRTADGNIYPGVVVIDSKAPLFHVEIFIKSIKIPVNEKINFNIPEYKLIIL